MFIVLILCLDFQKEWEDKEKSDFCGIFVSFYLVVIFLFMIFSVVRVKNKVKKEKMLAPSILSFSQNVFKSPPSWSVKPVPK